MTDFLIWSEEHRRWWRPGSRGYTDLIAEAGRYPKHVADDIVKGANFGSTFNEIAIPVPEGLDALISRSRGKADPLTNVDERALALEAQINAKLAEMGPTATATQVQAVMDDMVPEGWEWVEAEQVGAPLTIRFTRYRL